MQGTLVLILGPSGSGKGTLIRHVKEYHPNFIFPVSCTTRAPRPKEKDGEVYYFISKEEFKTRIANDEFLEWAIVHGDNYYGTLKKEILAPLERGQVVFREVDIQGVQSIKKLIPQKNLITIFLMTPSWDALKSRIVKRAQISESELQKREESYHKEIAFKDNCDHIIINRQGHLNEAIEQLETILAKIS